MGALQPPRKRALAGQTVCSGALLTMPGMTNTIKKVNSFDHARGAPHSACASFCWSTDCDGSAGVFIELAQPH